MSWPMTDDYHNNAMRCGMATKSRQSQSLSYSAMYVHNMYIDRSELSLPG